MINRITPERGLDSLEKKHFVNQIGGFISDFCLFSELEVDHSKILLVFFQKEDFVYLVTFVSSIMETIPWLLMKLLCQA